MYMWRQQLLSELHMRTSLASHTHYSFGRLARVHAHNATGTKMPRCCPLNPQGVGGVHARLGGLTVNNPSLSTTEVRESYIG